MRAMVVGRGLFVGADALPLWVSLWGAVASTALGAGLAGLGSLEDGLLCAAIGAIPSAFVGICIRLSMESPVATPVQRKRRRLVGAALLGAAIGALALCAAFVQLLSNVGDKRLV